MEAVAERRTRGVRARVQQGPRQIVVYKQDAIGADAPLRMIRGPHTGLGDPHGIFFDGANNEIVVANHGNQNGRETLPGSVAPQRRGGGGERGTFVGGRFDPPSITVYPGEGSGDIAPIRRIQGPKTGLNWPMALSVDTATVWPRTAGAVNRSSSSIWIV